MSTSAPNERSISNPLCDFRLGSVVTSDYVTPLTLWGRCLLRTRFHEVVHGFSVLLGLVRVFIEYMAIDPLKFARVPDTFGDRGDMPLMAAWG